MSIIGGDVDSVSSSLPSSAAGSAPGTPRNRVKFLCSHGGKILPRPADGHLKYVAGETRVICVHRDITFHELMKKLTTLIDGEMILKYQLLPEDLDVLVTVKSDEDLRHMIDECDRHDLLGAPRLRTFLFPANPIVIDHHHHHIDHHSLEQRYINSINGIIIHPSPTYIPFKPAPINTSFTTFSLSSACSSPRTSPETTTAASGINHELHSLHKINSPACTCNLCCNSNPNHHHQPPQPHHFQPHQSSLRPPLDRHPHKVSGPENLVRTRSTGFGDCYYTFQTDHTPTQYPRTNRGHVVYQRGLPYDDYYGNCRYESTDSPPGSPLARSPGIMSGRS